MYFAKMRQRENEIHGLYNIVDHSLSHSLVSRLDLLQGLAIILEDITAISRNSYVVVNVSVRRYGIDITARAGVRWR